MVRGLDAVQVKVPFSRQNSARGDIARAVERSSHSEGMAWANPARLARPQGAPATSYRVLLFCP